MIFNSVTFLIFLLLTVILYWLLPKQIRLAMLSIGSLVFYGFWRVEFIPLLIIAAIVDYFCANEIHRRQEPKARKNFLIFSLVINLGLLFYFKYLVFFADNVQWALTILGTTIQIPALKIILPMGISFYTFETISYTVDVYRKHIKPERNFLSYLTFLVYYPHLVAGPVLRAADILGQLNNRKAFDIAYLAEGFKRILCGLFLKVCLADNIASLVDAGFDQPLATLSAIDVWTLAFLFGFQIYFDFCAYSHIAIGCAKMMGITFPENFNFPYIAISPKDFWKRWHISLSAWIKDYLYLPLTGQTVTYDQTQGLSENKSSKTIPLFLTWAIMGLWHGAKWTFVFWGIYHAFLVFLHRNYLPIEKWLPNKYGRFLSWCFWLPLLMLGWIPFRAHSLALTLGMFGKLFSIKDYGWLGMRENNYLIALITMILFLLAYCVDKFALPKLEIGTYRRALVETVALSVVIALVFIFLRPVTQFIYFQF